MMKRLGTAVLTQRRRALRIALLAFMAGTILYFGQPGQVGILPVPLFAGLLYAGFVTPAAVLTAVLLPGLTALSDAVQWSRLGIAVLTASFPGVLHPLTAQPLISATLVILGAMALMRAERLLAPRPALALA